MGSINEKGNPFLPGDYKYNDSSGDALSSVVCRDHLSDDFDLTEPIALVDMINRGKDYYYKRGKDFHPDFPELHLRMRDPHAVDNLGQRYNQLPLLDYKLNALNWFTAEPKLVVYYNGVTIAVFTYQWVGAGDGR